ncbi:PAC2 family protein [Thermodesulforhabdus norvegica]|uniref:Predicted ATP-dependent carboligase, ATP-grasp superfamily n=1 Tax=Thermodesulforhabdus norvegica TaxID=39841 RepID=A0A1I4U665_9BACT|nr:PAC2 family protein [Thermodesulforhabdus norvegica]SFM84301.1 Predicted ATP-dependent carboligase, ATP-grasp superfamily [Thermodesulforhabdus norvegica]
MHGGKYHTGIIGFSGWCDAGAVVQNTVNHIISSCEAEELEKWELDSFLHSDRERPQIKIEHGIVRGLSWPAMTFYRLRARTMDKLLIAFGPEPSTNWRIFSRELINRLDNYGIRRIVLLGSLYDQIFHDEVFVSAVVMTPAALNVAKSAGCRLIQYEGPAAVHGAVMMEAQNNRNMETIAIWSHVPFYLKGPHEKAMVVMLDVLSRMTAVNFPHGNLDRQWAIRLKQLEKLLQEDEELRNLIETLKHQSHQPFRALPGAPPSLNAPESPPKIIHIDDFIKKKRENDLSSQDD